MIQHATIPDWRPNVNPNGGTPHRMVQQKRHDTDANVAYVYATSAGWKRVDGRVRLTITLVQPRNPLPDKDNLHASMKGVIDGLKLHVSPWIKPRPRHPVLSQMIGFFTDDNDKHCELEINATVEKGKKEVRLSLESLSDSTDLI